MAKQERKRLSRRMDKGAQLWLFKCCRANHWRVASWLDIDDLIQDGYMHYQRILAKYPKVCEPSHLMSLFQITFCNHLNDLSKKRTRLAEVPDGLDALPDIEDSLGWSEICRVITEAPPDVRRALKLLYVRGGKYADPEKRLGERLVTRVREYLCQTQYAGRIK